MNSMYIEYFTKELYEINRKLRPDSPFKIKPRAKNYLEQCLNTGKPVNILTQCCRTKYLEVRKVKQGGKLIPLKSEVKLWQEEIPQLIDLFKKYGFKIDWIFSFTRPDSDTNRTTPAIELEFMEMYQNLAKDISDILLCDWEKEFLIEKIKPDEQVLNNFDQYVKPDAFEWEFERRFSRILAEVKTRKMINEKDLKNHVKKRIAMMAEEAVVITKKLFPDGLIIIPTEEPQRFDFFKLLVPNFKELLICTLKTAPWRMGE